MYEKVYTLNVFVRPAEARSLIERINAEGDFYVGKYRNVIWMSAEGWEEFTPVLGSSPVSGVIGTRTGEAAVCLEFSLPLDRTAVERLVNDVIIPNHPWEQPVIRVREELLFVASG